VKLKFEIEIDTAIEKDVEEIQRLIEELENIMKIVQEFTND
jgi:hypothetical protein